MAYPEEILIVRGSPEFELLENHSELFRTIMQKYADNDEYTLTPFLFGGDLNEWRMFVDVFFPELGVSSFFIFKNNSVRVNPSRGTKEDLQQLLRYLMLDEDTMMTFVRNQARKQLNYPMTTAPRGLGVGQNSGVFRNYNEGFNNNAFNNNNNNYDNNSGLSFGFKNENEENMLGKLSNRNAKKYFPNQGGRRQSRKLRKRRQTRRRKNCQKN